VHVTEDVFLETVRLYIPHHNIHKHKVEVQYG